MAMADNFEESGDEARGDSADNEGKSQVEFQMELRDSLPGGRAVIGVEQDGEFIWLASKQHISQQAVDEFVEQITRIVHERWWVQNWPGSHR
jgi:hypothetical protein